jgi:hypothetical protein
VLRSLLWARVGKAMEKTPERLDPTLIETIRAGMGYTAADLCEARFARTACFGKVQQVFERCDVIASPTLSAPALPIGLDPLGRVQIAGQDVGTIRGAWYPYTFPFNLTGHPALSIPCGLSSAGLPIGLQLVGRWHEDRFLLDCAAKLEEALGFFGRPSAAKGGLTSKSDGPFDIPPQDDCGGQVLDAGVTCDQVAQCVEAVDGRHLDLHDEVELAADRRNTPHLRIARELVENAERRRAHQRDQQEGADQALFHLPDVRAIATDDARPFELRDALAGSAARQADATRQRLQRYARLLRQDAENLPVLGVEFLHGGLHWLPSKCRSKQANCRSNRRFAGCLIFRPVPRSRANEIPDLP